MIIMITGVSHTGKTMLAQKMLEKYRYPYLSIEQKLYEIELNCNLIAEEHRIGLNVAAQNLDRISKSIKQMTRCSEKEKANGANLFKTPMKRTAPENLYFDFKLPD